MNCTLFHHRVLQIDPAITVLYVVYTSLIWEYFPES